PGVGAAISAASGLLPLRLSRQASAAPLAVGVGVVPAQPRHGVVIEFGVGEVVRVERGTLRMARLAAAVLKLSLVAHSRPDGGAYAHRGMCGRCVHGSSSTV